MKRLLLLPILLILFGSFASADFWEMHLRDSEISINLPPDSFFKQAIRGNEDIFYGCNAGTDATVLWYLREETQFNYQQSHVRAAYENCLIAAGSDEQLQVCCYGMGVHHTQDAFISHGFDGRDGYTSKCIRKYLGGNLLLHAACENAMTSQVLNNLPVVEKDRILLLAGNAYDIFKDETVHTEEYDNRYAELLAKSFGFTTDEQKDSFFNAVFIVGDFVKTGQGSGYLRIYEQNREIPLSWYLIPIFIIVGAIALIIVAIWLGQNNWKFMIMFLSSLLIAGAIYFIINIVNGQAFAWFRSFANFLPTLIYGGTALIAIIGILVSLRFNGVFKIFSTSVFAILLIFSGYILITTNFGIVFIADFEEQRAKSIEVTNNFLVSEDLLPLDASGLDILRDAERPFDFIKWVILVAISWLFVSLLVVMRD